MSDAVRGGLLALLVLAAGCSSSGEPTSTRPPDVGFAVWPVLAADATPEQCADELVDTWCRAGDGPRIGADAIEAAAARFQDQGGWVVDLVFTDDGIEAFNALAAACFEMADECPTARLAIEIDGRVVSAPQVQAPLFARDSIVISGVLDQDQAEEIAAALSG